MIAQLSTTRNALQNQFTPLTGKRMLIWISLFCVSILGMGQSQPVSLKPSFNANWSNYLTGSWTLREAKAVNPKNQRTLSAFFESTKGYVHILSFAATALRNGYLNAQYKIEPFANDTYAFNVNIETNEISSILLPPRPGSVQSTKSKALAKVPQLLILIEGRLVDISSQTLTVESSVQGIPARLTFVKRSNLPTMTPKASHESTPRQNDVSQPSSSTEESLLGKWHLISYEFMPSPDSSSNEKAVMEQRLRELIATNSYKNNVHVFEPMSKYTFQYYSDRPLNGEKITIDGEYFANEVSDATDSTIRGLITVSRLDFQSSYKTIRAEELAGRSKIDRDVFLMDGLVTGIENNQVSIKKEIREVRVVLHFKKIE